MSKIAVSSPASGTATYTISAPAGSTDRTISLPDATGTILTTATAGVPVNGPAFIAASVSNQTGISNSTFTKVLFTESFDTNNCFASSTFTPTVAGYYQVNAGLDLGSGTVTQGLVRIYKNGSSIVYGNGVIGDSVSELYVTANGLVYCNGTTDYLEVFVYMVSSSNVVYASSTFSAFLARSAT